MKTSALDRLTNTAFKTAGIALAVSVLADTAYAAASITAVPTIPVERQRVFVHYQTEALCEAQIDPGQTRVSMSNNVVDVALVMPEEAQGCTNFGVDLVIEIGELPIGTYTVRTGVAKIEPYLQGVLPADTLASTTVSVIAGATGGPVDNYAGIWWSPEEPGWSLVVYETANDLLIGGWLTHGADGAPTWFFSQPGTWIFPNVYEAPLLATSGGPYFGAPSPQPAATVRRVGTTRYTFGGDGSVVDGKVVRTGRITYDVDGVSGTRAIQTAVDD